MEEEIWKPITENPNYEISSLGRVRALDRVTKASDGKIYNRKGKLLTPTKNVYGRLCVNISIQNKATVKYISILIANAFIPNPENHPYVLHKNDIKTDNRIENLYWGTQKMNMADKTVNNEWYGDNHQNSKITVKQANEIRELLKEGKLTQSAIGKRYGITQSTVGHIKSGRDRKFDNL